MSRGRPTHKHDSRREVEGILSEGEFNLTVLRAAIIIGNGNDSFRIVSQLARRLPLMITPRWVRNECQPIAVDDIIAYLVGIVETPESAGTTYEVGGPEVLTYEDFLDRTAHVAGRPSMIVPVPVLTPRLSSHWVRLVTDVPGDIARPLIHGLRNEVTAEDPPIRSLLPIELTSYDVAIERALDGDRDETAETRVSAKLDEMTTTT